MSNQGVIAKLEEQEWLQPVETTLHRIINGIFRAAGKNGKAVENFLHGTWLGHPLHAALTDVPLGAWTAAVVCDGVEGLSENKELQSAADASIAVGLVGAAGAALAGLVDWQRISGKERRIGLIHGLTNVGGVALFTASLIARKQGHRSAGKVLSAVGLTAAVGSAWLGGHLVYEKQVGVDHTAGESYPKDFARVMRDKDLKEGQLKRVEVHGAGILLVRHMNAIHAMAETCTHMGGPLSQGKLVDGAVQCPWHGSQFDLRDGHIVNGPAVHAEPCFDVRIRGGEIEVRLRTEEAGPKENAA